MSGKRLPGAILGGPGILFVGAALLFEGIQITGGSNADHQGWFGLSDSLGQAMHFIKR